MTRPKSVWIAEVSHKHGTNLYVGSTRRKVLRKVVEYCKYSWKDEEVPGPVPRKHEDICQQYFDHMIEIEGGEYCDINQHPIDP